VDAKNFRNPSIGQSIVFSSSPRFHARQAALALLKMAKTTSDAKLAAGLIEIAADLKDQAGELPPAVSDTGQAGSAKSE
jgi:hypothetical protein